MTNDRTLRALQRFRNNLEVYAQNCLTIRDKAGNVTRFPGFNAAQRYAHEQLERQLRETGKVRALFLKGRQQGISTYVALRYYRRATLYRGTNVYILSHEQSASDNLFKMVDRFQVNNPLAPHVGSDNAKELVFDRLDSSYVVATAGQKAGGRSKTTTLFHGSEVAFWQNAGDHFAASVQTVPDLPGTEIILESTGNGASGEFYERWQDAQNGVGDYVAIFIPWFWQEEYTRPAPPDFELSDEPGDNGISEREYAEMFNLSPEQMAWRRAKVAELRSVQLFDQEYPATAEMAFTSADLQYTFIKPIVVLRARKRKNVEGYGPLIIGADPSGPGKDRFAIAARQGHKMLWVEDRQVPDTPEAVEWCKAIIRDWSPDRFNIDLGGIGHAIYSYLKASEYGPIVRGVNFGSTSQFKNAYPKMPGPQNRRAEMWSRLLEWLELPEGVSLPDKDVLQADLTGPRIKPLVSGDFLLESKKQMRDRGIRSPDLADALALTFADLDGILKSDRKPVDKPDPKPVSVQAKDPPASFSTMPDAYDIGGEDSWMGF